MRTRVAAIVVVSVVLAAPVLGLTGAATEEYAVSVPGSIPIPERTVTFEGEEFTISSIAQIDANEDLTVEVTAPDGNYVIQLRTAEEDSRIHEIKGSEAVENGEVTFETGSLDPGVYIVAIRDSENNTFTDVHPVIVAGYDVSATVPSSAETDSTITVSAQISSQSDLNVSAVETLLVKDNTTWIADMQKNDGTYEASISLSDHPPGEYSVYVVVRGEKKVKDEPMPIGISKQHDLEITESSTPTESSGGGGGGGGSGQPVDTVTPSPTVSPTPASPTLTPTPASPTSTPTPVSTATTTRSPTPTRTEPTPTTTPSPTATARTTTRTTSPSPSPTEEETEPTRTVEDTEDGSNTPRDATTATATPSPTETDTVITPVQTTSRASGTTGGTTATPGQPGFTPIAVLAALLVILVFRRRPS